MNAEWVREIRDQCVAHKVSFFFKQWGGVHKSSNGRELDGRERNEKPTRSLMPTIAGWQRFLVLAHDSGLKFGELEEVASYWWDRKLPCDVLSRDVREVA